MAPEFTHLLIATVGLLILKHERTVIVIFQVFWTFDHAQQVRDRF
jgi:hypothetical protein